LGHRVSWRDPRWGTVGNGVAILYARGVADDARRMPNRERLGRQVRGVARLGTLAPDALLRSTTAAIPKHARRLNAIFDDADVLVPPSWVSRPSRSASGTLEAGR